VQAYASAAALWNIVPILGWMIALVWSIVVQVLGLASAHETSAGRSLAAVLMPLVLCCVIALGFAVLAAWSFTSMLPSQ